MDRPEIFRLSRLLRAATVITSCGNPFRCVMSESTPQSRHQERSTARTRRARRRAAVRGQYGTNMPSAGRDERIATLAHELRSPVAALSNVSRLLAERAANEPTLAAIAAIVGRQTMVMRALIDELLDASRLEAQCLELRMGVVDLRDVVRGTIEDLRAEIDRAGLTCEVELATHPVEVAGDPLKLGQALGNLLSNSIKFTPASGTLRVTLDRDGGFARLTVRDTGIGIEPELLAVIFDRYQQAHRGRFGGLGLGLPIVKGLVELHGGTVSAASAGPCMGCTMTIRLPMRLAGASAA